MKTIRDTHQEQKMCTECCMRQTKKDAQNLAQTQALLRENNDRIVELEKERDNLRLRISVLKRNMAASRDAYLAHASIDPVLRDARLLSRLADCAPGDTCFDKYREAAARIQAATEGGRVKCKQK